MGVQVNLQDIQSGFLSAAAHTANNTLIETAFNQALDRTASTDNAMEVDLDMGNQRAINAADAVLNADLVTKRQLDRAILGIGTGTLARTIERQNGSAAVSRVFTLGAITYTLGNNSLEVVRNGQELDITEDYTETSTTSITLTFDPNDDDKFKFKVLSTS